MPETQQCALDIAHAINGATSDQWPKIIKRLMRDRQFSAKVRQLNVLPDDHERREEAVRAWKRIGLWHAG